MGWRQVGKDEEGKRSVRSGQVRSEEGKKSGEVRHGKDRGWEGTNW